MRNSVLLCLFVFLPGMVFSQVGINTDTPNSRAVLDLRSPTNDQGLLVPRLGTVQRTAQAFVSRLTEAENGLLVFDTDDKLFYYWMYPSWKAVGAETGGTVWRSGDVPPNNTLGENGDFYLNVADGSVYQRRGGVYTLSLNIRGSKGDRGDKGDKGDNGPIGLTGPAGPQGDIGPVGPQGPKGDQGDLGPTGPQGPQGEKGDQGDTGPVGPAGPQGEKGDKGDPGLIGLTGPAGPQGDAGPMGPQGPQGEKGDKGDTGAVGPAGPQGEVGPMGPQGPQGDKGDTGAIGPAGLQGEVGPMGPQGPQGEPGVPVAFNARTVNSNYTVTTADDVIIISSAGITITLPSAVTVPGKLLHIRHNFGLGGLLGATCTVRAPSGNIIVDGNGAQTFTLGGLLGAGPTAITVIAVDSDKWYVIGKF